MSNPKNLGAVFDLAVNDYETADGPRSATYEQVVAWVSDRRHLSEPFEST
ncbi:MAG TPA: hypothetical protein VGI19_06905 [Candidatus Cybelea sp.]|jgi:hypothetical protein